MTSEQSNRSHGRPAEATQSDDQSAPPPVKTGRMKPAIVISCGIILAGLLLVVVSNLNDADPGSRRRDALRSGPV